MKTSLIPALCLAATAIGLATQSAVAQTFTAASYVQNGLVGQWDGIENAGAGLHAATTNFWVDLTGNSGDFALFTGVASFTANGLRKDTQGVMATNVTPTARSDVRTIEVVVSDAPSSGWVNAFYITKDQHVSFNNDRNGGNRDYFFDYNKFGWRTLQKPTQETVAVSFTNATSAAKCYQNGAVPTGSKTTNNWGSPRDSSAMHIGGRLGYSTSGDYTTKGYTIHAVRLYTNELSAAEIRQNATIDQIRFFGAPAEALPSSSKYAVTATAGVGGMVAADDVNAAPNAMAKNAVNFSDGVYPIALRAIPLQGWKFSGWEGDFSCLTEGSASTPVIVVSSSCGRNYHATFKRDSDNPEIPYITEGLVGRWDGIENAGVGIHNTSTNRWVDLSEQGGDFLVLTNTASFSDAGLTKNATGICATNLLAHTGVLTIESAVSGIPSSGWVDAVYLNEHQTVTLRNDSNNLRQFFFDYNKLKWRMDGQPDELTVSVTYAMNGDTPEGQQPFYLDGAPPQNGEIYGSGMYWWAAKSTNTWIGARVGYPDGGDYKTFGYTVHALRFYNRVLNAGEIAYNSAVDRLRFRGLRKEGFAYRLENGNVKCQLRAWMDGLGGTVKMNGEAAATDSVATSWVPFGTPQTATFTATPAEGWTFLGWTGDTDAIVSRTANDLTVGVSATNGVALQAVFTQTSRYVQNGLIGFWDAKENAGYGHHDADASAWKDLTGKSGDFLLNAASGVFEADALYKVRRGRMAFNAARRTDVRTIEAVVSTNLPNNAWAMPIFISHKQHISIKDQGEGNKRLYFFDREITDIGHYGWETDERPTQMTVTLLSESATSATNFFVNAVKPEGTQKGNWWGDSPGGVMAIGARGPVSGGDATATGYRVHAIRFYDRELTPAEIEKNARRDAIRYFGESEGPFTLIVR